MPNLKPLALLLMTAVLFPTSSTADDRSKKMQQEVDQLKQQIEQLSEQVEQQTMQAQEGGQGKTQIGGYGELHYNNLNGKDGASDKSQIDFHRFVLLFSHQFSDRISFVSELELEHSLAGDGKPGEVELEQAYIDFKDANELGGWQVGLFLVPIGFLNRYHEPATFYGVERNNVEKNIIPTTWWEAGAARYGKLTDALSYTVALHSGLNLSSESSYKIRSGRQKVAEAVAEDFALTANLQWQIAAGMQAGLTLNHQLNADQTDGDEVEAATLIEVHASLEQGHWGVRALYAGWNIDGSGPAAIGADKQEGFYIEPAYRLSEQVGFFARFSEWDNTAGNNLDSSVSQTDIGVNYYPHPNVVLKADLQRTENADDSSQEGFNLGVGYHF